MDHLEVELEVGKRMCPHLSVMFPAGTKESVRNGMPVVSFVMKAHVVSCVGIACGVWDRARECCGHIPYPPPTPATVVSAVGLASVVPTAVIEPPT
jgi:hypothetical protein